MSLDSAKIDRYSPALERLDDVLSLNFLPDEKQRKYHLGVQTNAAAFCAFGLSKKGPEYAICSLLERGYRITLSFALETCVTTIEKVSRLTGDEQKFYRPAPTVRAGAVDAALLPAISFSCPGESALLSLVGAIVEVNRRLGTPIDLNCGRVKVHGENYYTDPKNRMAADNYLREGGKIELFYANENFQGGIMLVVTRGEGENYLGALSIKNLQ